MLAREGVVGGCCLGSARPGFSAVRSGVVITGSAVAECAVAAAVLAVAGVVCFVANGVVSCTLCPALLEPTGSIE